MRVFAELVVAASPLFVADCGIWAVDTAERAEHEEDGDVSNGTVDGLGGVGRLGFLDVERRLASDFIYERNVGNVKWEN